MIKKTVDKCQRFGKCSLTQFVIASLDVNSLCSSQNTLLADTSIEGCDDEKG
jgi:hypothetical protein